MNKLQLRIFADETQNAPAGHGERRREPRTRMARPVYVQPAETGAARFEEVRTVTDFSRSGLYFITQRKSYREGMQLYVIPAFGCFNFEYVGKVVRVERLPDGDYGIAVQLLRLANSGVKACTPTKSAYQTFASVDQVPAAFRDDEPDGLPDPIK